MVNLEQLEQLVAFADEGTITRAADALMISQPALTRSLQKLETELDIQLFDRQKNKTTLTETGRYTVEQARALLAQAEDFLTKIHHQASLNTTIFVGTVAPGPQIELETLADEQQLSQEFHFELLPEADLLEKLEQEELQLIATEQPIEKEGIISQFFLMEQLQLSIPKKHILSERDEIQLSDLKGLSMLIQVNLGSWDDLIATLTDTNFIEQSSVQAFTDLINASDLPHFTTNVTEDNYGTHPDRVSIPITDDSATKTFYISVTEKNKSLLTNLGL